MKLRRITVENCLSFLEPTELRLDDDISILIGPNGGGKTNLLDITTAALRRYFLIPWESRRTPTPDVPDRQELYLNDQLNQFGFEQHLGQAARPQIITLELEATASDVQNIQTIHTTHEDISHRVDAYIAGVQYKQVGYWDVSLLSEGARFSYSIVNGEVKLPEPGASRTFLEYLRRYEADKRIREHLGLEPLSIPFLSLPTSRGAAGFPMSVSLASYDEANHKKEFDIATSRSGGTPFIAYGVGRMATAYRRILEREGSNTATVFANSPNVALLTQALGSLGYSFELRAGDPLRNEYLVRLRKHGELFEPNRASSGEKELLLYVFGLYALGVKDALIVVDEPELHLHPTWQISLLRIFERLVKDTNSQILLATHSPTFVSPQSLQYVSRVYSDRRQSRIVRLDSSNLPNAKHLFSIVKSETNERMFFADKVVLVEGLSDRIFFEAAFRAMSVTTDAQPTVEFVAVGGKTFFDKYEKVLASCCIPYAIIADLDYAFDIGPPEVRALFGTDPKKISASLKSSDSKDRLELVSSIESALAAGNTDRLRDILAYLKQRHLQLRSDLNAAEENILRAFIESWQRRSVFVLKRGDLESYLPSGYNRKDIENVIRLVEQDSFVSLLAVDARRELETLMTQIAIM